jgi:hypothetical protein
MSETWTVSLAKVLTTDSTAIIEAIANDVSKAAADNTALSDKYTVSFDKQLVENTSITETRVIDYTKGTISDTTTIVDSTANDVSKNTPIEVTAISMSGLITNNSFALTDYFGGDFTGVAITI